MTPAMEEKVNALLGPNRIRVEKFCNYCKGNHLHLFAKTPNGKDEFSGGTDSACCSCGHFSHIFLRLTDALNRVEDQGGRILNGG